MVLRSDTRQKIQQETEYVESKGESNDPFKNRGDIGVVIEIGDHEYNGKAYLNNDEYELHPERDTDDAVVSIMDSQTLVLGADEDGADDVAANKKKKEPVVKMWVVVGVENAQQD